MHYSRLGRTIYQTLAAGNLKEIDQVQRLPVVVELSSVVLVQPT